MNSNQNNNTSASRQNESGTFARDVIWVGLAQVFTSLIFGIATLPALTKHYSAEVYGIWVQILVTVTLLSPFFAMELDMAVVRFLANEDSKETRRKVLGSMLLAILMFSVLAFMAVNLLVSQFSIFLFADPKYATFVRLTFLWVIADALFVFFSSYFRARKKIRTISFRQMAYAIAVMVLVIALTSRGYGLEWVVTGVIAVEATLALIFLIMIVREIGWPRLELNGLRTFLVFSVPQIPGTALLWLVAFSDRYFITHFLGLSQAGIYSSSSQLAGLTRLFYTPVCYVLYPALTRLWDQKRLIEVRSYLQQSTRFLLTLGIPAAIGIALLSQQILQLLTTSEFLVGWEIVLLVSIGAIFLGIFQINEHVILLAKQTRLLPVLISAAAIVSVVMNIILIPHIGILGAAISNVASYFVLGIIVTLIARKYTEYFLDFKFLLKILGATVPMAIFLYFLKWEGIGGIILEIIAGTLIYIAGLWLLRAFSDQDKQLIRKNIGNLMSNYTGRKQNTIRTDEK